ncbi:hypothetical protein D3C78_1135320 [compost metagenome]
MDLFQHKPGSVQHVCKLFPRVHSDPFQIISRLLNRIFYTRTNSIVNDRNFFLHVAILYDPIFRNFLPVIHTLGVRHQMRNRIFGIKKIDNELPFGL